MSFTVAIKENIKSKTSDELVSIWVKNDREEWSDSAFEAIKQVLTERGVPLPQQTSLQIEVNPKAPMLWRLLRVVFTFLFMASSLVVFSSVCGAIASHLTKRGMGKELPQGIFFVAGIICVVGFAFLSRIAAGKIKVSTPDKSYSGELIAVIIATATAFAGAFLGLPEAVYGISFLVAVVGSLYVVFKCKTFRWRNYVVAGLVPGLMCVPIWLPSMVRVQNIVFISQHTQAFQETIADTAKLFTHDDLMKAVSSDKIIGEIPNLKDGVLVLDAESGNHSAIDGLAVSELAVYIPDSFSAKQPGLVHVVVVLGKIGSETDSRFSIGDSANSNASLVAPLLVYRWPEKQLVCSGKLVTGCYGSDSPRKVYSKAADSLIRFLQEKGK